MMKSKYKTMILAWCMATLAAPALALEQAPTIQEMIALAEQGQSQAQFELAMSYQRGQKTPKDYALAVQWLEKAASQQHIDAQLQLGMMYFSGQGVTRDNTKAAEWFRLAAQQQASRQGVSYHAKGIVPEGASEKIVWWLERSAELGQASAAKLLAQVHQQLGSRVKAMQWVLIGQRLGQQDGDTLWDNAQTSGSADEQTQAKALADEWLEKRRP